MEIKKLVFICGLVFSLASCTTGNCRSQQLKIEQAGPAVMPKENKLLPAPGAAERVRIYRANGSLQCGQGKSIEPSMMAKDLKEIHIYKSSMENDGKMRIQMCGSPTGNVNVYEIDKTDLDQAISYGFSEWIH